VKITCETSGREKVVPKSAGFYHGGVFMGQDDARGCLIYVHSWGDLWATVIIKTPGHKYIAISSLHESGGQERVYTQK
jgi:hypothetical protein